MVAINYVWDPFTDNVIKEMDDVGNVIASYTTEPKRFGNLISQERGGTTSYYHYDGQGSTLALTDDSGNVTDTYQYNAFGETTSSSGTTENPYRYIGEKGYQYDEETNDYYVRARTYEPQIARWQSVDPIGFNGSKWNLYEYVNSNPMVFIDPSGTFRRLQGWKINVMCGACYGPFNACIFGAMGGFTRCLIGWIGWPLGADLICSIVALASKPISPVLPPTIAIICTVGTIVIIDIGWEQCRFPADQQIMKCINQYNRCTFVALGQDDAMRVA